MLEAMVPKDRRIGPTHTFPSFLSNEQQYGSNGHTILSKFRAVKTLPWAWASWLATTASLQPSVTQNIPIAPWGIHWYIPASIILLLLIGTSSAVGHHIFYSTLDNELAKDQEWTILIGTGLTFLCRASLSSVVVISRKQWMWRTLRNRSMSLEGIGAMFGVTSDPLLFFNFEVLRRARLSTLMALVVWMIPISAIFTPGTISVVERVPNPTSCQVPSIEFGYDEKTPSVIIDVNGTPLGNANSGGYLGPSSSAHGLFTATAFLGQATPMEGSLKDTTLPEGCVAGCTYEITFKGLGLRCTELGKNINLLRL